VLTKPVRLFKI